MIKSCYIFLRNLIILFITIFSSFSPLIILSGCNSGFKKTFDVRSKIHILNHKNYNFPKKKDVQIIVDVPHTLQMLDGQDVVIRGIFGEMFYLKDAQWSDQLPNLVQSHIIHNLEDTNILKGVGKRGSGLAMDYRILTDIRSFNIEHDNQNKKYAHISLNIKIVDERTGYIFKEKLFSKKKFFKKKGSIYYIEAIDDTFSLLLEDITFWILTSL